MTEFVNVDLYVSYAGVEDSVGMMRSGQMYVQPPSRGRWKVPPAADNPATTANIHTRLPKYQQRRHTKQARRKNTQSNSIDTESSTNLISALSVIISVNRAVAEKKNTTG